MSNPFGKGKAANKEFIFSVKYDPDLKRGDVALTTAISRWNGGNISTYLGEMFPCRNGLPIYISHDGVTREKNPQFLGLDHFMDEFRNRDYRFISCTHLPDRKSWVGSGAAENQLPNTTGKPYPDPVYPEVPYNPNDPAFSDGRTLYTPALLTVNFTHNAYGSRKFMPEGTRNTYYDARLPAYPSCRSASDLRRSGGRTGERSDFRPGLELFNQ
jgi:hypothetical protein